MSSYIGYQLNVIPTDVYGTAIDLIHWLVNLNSYGIHGATGATGATGPAGSTTTYGVSHTGATVYSAAGIANSIQLHNIPSTVFVMIDASFTNNISIYGLDIDSNTGPTSQPDGRFVTLINPSNTSTMTFVNQTTSSVAGNSFLLSNNANVLLREQGAISFVNINNIGNTGYWVMTSHT